MHRLQKTGREGPALKSAAAWIRFAVIVIAASAADLWTKAWAQHWLETGNRYADAQGAPRHSLPLLDLLWQANHGAVFGIGQHRTGLFIVFTLAALGLLAWLYAQSRRRAFIMQIMLSLIVAGALGNLYDRVTFGFVRDFLRLKATADWAFWGGPEGYLWPYVFNVADVWISIGVVGLAILWLLGEPVCGQKCAGGKEQSEAETQKKPSPSSPSDKAS